MPSTVGALLNNEWPGGGTRYFIEVPSARVRLPGSSLGFMDHGGSYGKGLWAFHGLIHRRSHELVEQTRLW